MGKEESLLKIGQLAELAGILSSRVRYYAKEALIGPVDRTQGGYSLFEGSKTMERLRSIEGLKVKQRPSLEEIKEKTSRRE